MKSYICAFALVFAGIPAFAQPNMACFKDTSMVDENIYKKDTVWSVKPAFQHGDWTIYYDYGLTKIKQECHYEENGLKTGVWKEYYKGGAKRSEWDYSKATVPLFLPDRNGTRMENSK